MDSSPYPDAPVRDAPAGRPGRQAFAEPPELVAEEPAVLAELVDVLALLAPSAGLVDDSEVGPIVPLCRRVGGC